MFVQTLFFIFATIPAIMLVVYRRLLMPPSQRTAFQSLARLAWLEGLVILGVSIWVYYELIFWTGFGALPYVIGSVILACFGFVHLAGAQDAGYGTNSKVVILGLHGTTVCVSIVAFVLSIPMAVIGLYWFVVPLFTTTMSAVIIVRSIKDIV